jgi:serine/threonine-protein kinase
VSTDLREVLQDNLGSAYTIERELGGGGMSRVFVAEERALGRRVVVKFLPVEAMSSGSIERFKREIAVAARLHHPHVVPLLSAGEVNGLPWYTMPLVEGETLRKQLERSTELPLPDAVRILRHVAEALAFAHAKGIVHRDIKPENILVSGEHALLADFGIAKALSVATRGDAEGLTSIGVAIGTPAYMAPEQAAADPAIDHRADVYAFGVVAYEVLTGKHPFAGRPPHAMLAAHLTEVPQPPTRQRVEIPAALATMVERCLAKDPQDRPQSFDEILQLLDGVRTIASPRQRRPSIAVLPMVNLSGDPDNEHFSDGLTDELIGVLGQLEELAVAGRTSVFALKGKGLDVRAIAEKLDVANVLEGTVRRSGSRLKIRVQLVDTHGLVLWSDAYDRQMTDVFEVQEEIAQAVVSALKVRFSGSRPLVRPATDDVAAYDLFLRGSFVHRRLAPGDLETAISYYEQAVARDPKFARAYAAMADATVLLGVFGGRSARVTLPIARGYAEKAIALDADHADSHWARAHVAMSEYDPALAITEYERALALDPSHTDARHLYSILLMYQGRFAEAEEHLNRTLATNPLHATASMTLGSLYVYKGEYERGIRQLNAAAELIPGLYYVREQLVHAYIQTGRHTDALVECERVASTGGARGAALMAYTLAVVGRTDEARAIVERLLRLEDGYQPPVQIAVALATLGNLDDAMTWLERGFEDRDPHLAGFQFRYEFRPLRGLPRFEALLRTGGVTRGYAVSSAPLTR